jgi:hypothetical protein
MTRLFALIALGFAAFATPSLAAPTGAVMCYVVANDAQHALNMAYTPDSRTAYNAKGGQVSVTHTGTGAYTVNCTGAFGSGIGFETIGNVQVNAVGNANTFCHINSWASGSVLFASTQQRVVTIGNLPPPVFFDEFTADVVCFGRGGGGGGGPAPADSEFSLLYVY